MERHSMVTLELTEAEFKLVRLCVANSLEYIRNNHNLLPQAASLINKFTVILVKESLKQDASDVSASKIL